MQSYRPSNKQTHTAENITSLAEVINRCLINGKKKERELQRKSQALDSWPPAAWNGVNVGLLVSGKLQKLAHVGPPVSRNREERGQGVFKAIRPSDILSYQDVLLYTAALILAELSLFVTLMMRWVNLHQGFILIYKIISDPSRSFQIQLTTSLAKAQFLPV